LSNGESNDEISNDESSELFIKYDLAAQRRFPSVNELTATLKEYLLTLEEKARKDMQNGTRWLYLFSDPILNVEYISKYGV
jgi:hypothetical protein